MASKPDRKSLFFRTPLRGKYIHHVRCGNIQPGQAILILGKSMCLWNCPDKKNKKCKGYAYYVQDYKGSAICSPAIEIHKRYELDVIIGLFSS